MPHQSPTVDVTPKRRWAPRTCCGRLRQRLITHEDPNHLHKTLGILCLLSFIYRYAYVWPTTGHLGLSDGSLFDWATMLAHIGLSTSSLIFHVIKRRKLNRPMMIWEEYRQHAIVFSVRCLSVFLFDQLVPKSVPDFARRATQCMFILAHHLLVDDITRRHGDRSHTTVRVDNSSSTWTKIVLRFYSFYQFLALASQLVPNAHSSDLAFNALIAIQSSAFLMTLYRKALVSHYTHGLVYSTCLVISAAYILSCLPRMLIAATAVAFVLRVVGRCDKYKIWVAFAAFSSPAVRAFVAHRASILRQHVHLPYAHKLQSTLGALELRSLGINADALSFDIDYSKLTDAVASRVGLQQLSRHVPSFDGIHRHVTGIQSSVADTWNSVHFNQLQVLTDSKDNAVGGAAFALLLVVVAYYVLSKRSEPAVVDHVSKRTMKTPLTPRSTRSDTEPVREPLFQRPEGHDADLADFAARSRSATGQSDVVDAMAPAMNVVDY